MFLNRAHLLNVAAAVKSLGVEQVAIDNRHINIAQRVPCEDGDCCCTGLGGVESGLRGAMRLGAQVVFAGEGRVRAVGWGAES
eukprot:669841-Rhodomonas_salina.3